MSSDQVPKPDTEFIAHVPESGRTEDRKAWTREVLLIVGACVMLPLANKAPFLEIATDCTQSE